MSITNTTFPPFSYTIERGKIREFALAIGDDNPIYYDVEVARAQGFRDIPIPPTFATAIDMWAGADFDMLVERLQLNALKVLHGEQSYRYLDDICAGDVLQGETRVTNVKEKAGLKLLTLETLYRNQAEREVLLATAVIIERQV